MKNTADQEHKGSQVAIMNYIKNISNPKCRIDISLTKMSVDKTTIRENEASPKTKESGTIPKQDLKILQYTYQSSYSQTTFIFEMQYLDPSGEKFLYCHILHQIRTDNLYEWSLGTTYQVLVKLIYLSV